MMTEDDNKVTLVDEEGKEHSFLVLDILTVNENDYAILLPEGTDFNSETDEQEAIIFRIVETEDEQTLLAVDDDQEWEEVSKAWEEVHGGNENFEELEEEEDRS